MVSGILHETGEFRGRFAALLLLFSSVLTCPANASPLFDDEAVLDVVLSGPVRDVVRSRKHSEPKEYPFTLSVDGVEIPVDVRVRGQSRKIVCSFPPMRLKFADESTAGTVFDGQGRLKLVTHCKSGSEKSETNVLDEYTAYRIFNVISDIGFRVRLLRIQYEDTDGKQRNLEEPIYGFLIESDAELADRLDGEVVEFSGIPFSRLNQRQTAHIFVFQYLIGNLDWSLVTATDSDICCHNIDLIEISEELYTIAYDFDFAGLVNAPYARTPEAKGTRRTYNGYCKLAPEKLAAGLDDIVAKRDEIMSVAANSPVIGDQNIDDRVRFVSKFFDYALEARDDMLEEFDKDCIGPR